MPEPFVFLSSETGNGISMLTEKITALGTRLIKIQQGERKNLTTIAVVWLTRVQYLFIAYVWKVFNLYMCHFLFVIRWFTFATPCVSFTPHIFVYGYNQLQSGRSDWLLSGNYFLVMIRICFPGLIYCDQEPLWPCYFLGVHIRLSTRCKIKFTLSLDCLQIIFL